MSGIVRKIDDLGRVAIPKEIRKVWGWFGGDEMEMILGDEEIVIRKHLPTYQSHIDHLRKMILEDPEVENKDKILADLDVVTAELKN